MATLEPADSLALAEQALRDVVAVVMTAQHGDSWMDNGKVVRPEVRIEWAKRREQEQRQRSGHMFGGLTDLSYADLGDLDQLIRSAGNWKQLFEPALGAREDATALIRVLLEALQRVRRPLAHTRPLLPFERDLIAGIAGLIRNRVTIYLSSQDHDGDYYPRIERVTDSLGNSFTSAGADPGRPNGVLTGATLVVGQNHHLRMRRQRRS